jgi:hypothetical protein
MRLGGREKGFNQPGCAGLVELVEIFSGLTGRPGGAAGLRHQCELRSFRLHLTALRPFTRLGLDSEPIFQNTDQVLQFVGACAFLADIFF